jgi:hypothetical protein
VYISATKDATMYFWVQGLHPTVHYLHVACVIAHRRDGDASLPQPGGGTTGRENGVPERAQALSECDDAGFI